jgi:hypothetical protein
MKWEVAVPLYEQKRVLVGLFEMEAFSTAFHTPLAQILHNYSG